VSGPFVPSTSIAVFGSSEPRPGDEAYRTAQRVGGLLATAGYGVITGGYGGVMEAASRGAREAGGVAIGVPCGIFEDRSANPWVTDVVAADDLYDRTRELIERAAGYIVLPGKAGTLAELAFLWALRRAGCLDGRPVILLGAVWPSLIELLERKSMLEPDQLRHTHLVETPEQALDALDRLLPTTRS
jgi:uncharacterized protein (TIGR00730 family)